MFAGALRRRVSADHEFLFVHTFELDPCAAAASRLINRVALFADNPFQTAALHFFQQRFGVAANRARVTNWRAAVSARGYSGAEFLENVLSRLQWQRN